MGETVTINGPFRVRRGALRKSGSRGRDRYTIQVESEPLLHNFDDRVVGAEPAKAIAAEIQREIRKINATVAPATLKYRQSAARALARGARWATKRYSGGRTGAKPPNPNSNRLFNDSGRLAGSIAARLSSSRPEFTINVAANRLDPRDFDDISFRRMLGRLRELVASLNPSKLAANPRVKKAIDDSISALITKARDERDARRVELRQARIRAAITAFNALRSVA